MAVNRLDKSFSIDKWRRMLGAGGRLRLSVTSADMIPAVLPGDIVEFEEAQLLHINPGDCVLLYSGGALRLRRIKERLIARSGEEFLLGCDANSDNDGEYHFEDIMAKMIAIERNGQKLKASGDSLAKARLRKAIKEFFRRCYLRLWLLFSRDHSE